MHNELFSYITRLMPGLLFENKIFLDFELLSIHGLANKGIRICGCFRNLFLQ